jgi:CRISPR-associated protein Cmr4
MFLKFKPFFLIAETSLHPGSGGEVGIVDLPIQREKHTNFPKIESSGLKGCIREAFEGLKKIEGKKSILIRTSECVKRLKEIFPNIEEEWREKIKENGGEKEVIKEDKEKNELIKFDQAIRLAFGSEEGDAHAGALAFTDARILFFPVKSLKGVFAWVTCQQVIERFREDMAIAGVNLPNYFKTVRKGTIANHEIVISNNQIVLEEFTFEVEENEDTKKLAQWFADEIFSKSQVGINDLYENWREKLRKNLVILSDDEFTDFVTHSTEIITRTKIDNITGTVASGALWTEEYLPQDTILYSIAMATAVRVKDEEKKGIFKADTSEEEAQKVLEFFKLGIPEVVQIGGNQTIGKGLTKIQILKQGG